MGDELNGVKEVLGNFKAEHEFEGLEMVITPDEIVDDWYQWRLVGYRLKGDHLILDPVQIINVQKRGIFNAKR